MLQNQDGRFARHPRNISKLEFICDKIAIKHNSLSTKLFDNLSKPNQVHHAFGTCAHLRSCHRSLPRIQSTASVKLVATYSGCLGHFAICQEYSPSPYPERTRMLCPPAACPS